MGTKNKLIDLNNHLFEQLERLNDESLTDEQLGVEIKRSKAMTDIGNTIIEIGALALESEKMRLEYGGRDVNIPLMLESK